MEVVKGVASRCAAKDGMEQTSNECFDRLHAVGSHQVFINPTMFDASFASNLSNCLTNVTHQVSLAGRPFHAIVCTHIVKAKAGTKHTVYMATYSHARQYCFDRTRTNACGFLRDA